MSNYLDHTHPDAFVDWKHLEAPNPTFSKECPRCKGFGGWNLKMNSYGIGKHLQCQCSHCNGWGYVSSAETCEGHEWVFEENLGRCYNRYRCLKCGKKTNVDSGD